MSFSSSSVTDISTSLLIKDAAFAPIHVKSLARGPNTFIMVIRKPAVFSAYFSGFFLAMLFGSISPTKNTTSVVMIVETDTKLRPHHLVTSTVTTVAMVR